MDITLKSMNSTVKVVITNGKKRTKAQQTNPCDNPQPLNYVNT